MSSGLKSFRKKLDRVSLLWVIKIVLFLSRLMPYWLGVRAGGLLGRVAYYLLPRERKRAREHLASVFKDKDSKWINRIARNSFAHLGKAMLELMLITPGKLDSVAHIEGADKLANALALGKGVIFVTGHIGNWELFGGMVAARSSLSVVAAPIEPEAVNDLLVMLRGKFGTRVILRGRPGASRDLIRIFRENRVLGILIDQDTDVEGAFVDFMGRPAWTPTAAASMAIKFKAPVLFGYIRRNADNRHSVMIEGPLELIRTGDEARDIVANTAAFTKRIEDAILKNPEQWVWMHRRWMRQP